MLQSMCRYVLSYADDRNMFAQKQHGLDAYPTKVELDRATFWDDIGEVKNYARCWGPGEFVLEMVEIKLCCDRDKIRKL